MTASFYFVDGGRGEFLVHIKDKVLVLDDALINECISCKMLHKMVK